MAGVSVKGIRATDGRKVQLSPADNPENNAGGSINVNELGAVNGIATLDGSSLVVQDPANATATPTASKIPLADGAGKLAAGWGGSANTLATLDGSSEVVQDPASRTLPRWQKFTVAESAFTAAAAAEDIELFSLVAGGIIHAVKIKHSTAFSGGTISAFTVSLGITGNLTKYASAFDVFQAVSDTTFQISNTVGSENHGAATSIRIEATATGDTVNNATAGSVDVWVMWSVAV